MYCEGEASCPQTWTIQSNGWLSSGVPQKGCTTGWVLAPGFSWWGQHQWGRGLKSSGCPGCQSDISFFSSCFLGWLGLRFHLQLHLPGGTPTLEGFVSEFQFGPFVSSWVKLYTMILSTPGVLASSRCCNKWPKLDGLKQQKLILSWFWRPKSRCWHGLTLFGGSGGELLTSSSFQHLLTFLGLWSHPSLFLLHAAFSVCMCYCALCLFCKDTCDGI